jgi:hypothetical protein
MELTADVATTRSCDNVVYSENPQGIWLSITNLRECGIWEDQEEDSETKNILSFNCLKPSGNYICHLLLQ